MYMEQVVKTASGSYVAGGVPDAPAAPVISQAVGDTNIVITWTRESTSQGLPISYYNLKVYDRDGTPAYEYNSTTCDSVNSSSS